MSERLSHKRGYVVRNAGSNSASFSPLSISGLKLWLKADAITGLNDGDAVTTWPDLSGNGNDATQATAAKKPVYKVNIINGKPVVRFDGLDDFLALTWAGGDLAQPTTVFAVVKDSVPASTTSYRIFCDGGGDSLKRQTLYSVYPTDQHFWGYYSGSVINSTTAVDTSAHIVGAIFSGASSVLYLDGASISTGNPGTQASDGVHLGLDQTGVANIWQGDLAEVIICDSALSAGNQALMNTYLNARFAIY